jgi:hypothetical protein
MRDRTLIGPWIRRFLLEHLLEPTKVGCPRPSHQALIAGGGRGLERWPHHIFSNTVALQEPRQSSLCVRLRPPRPAMRSLRPTAASGHRQ